jgi:histidyl-tRNA synthetase
MAGPDVDAEMILVARALWRELGLVEGRHVRLEINSLGQPDERRAHRAALVAYFEQHTAALDEDSQRRLHTNPLRILDSKHPGMQPLVEAAPRLMDFLGEASLAHFAAVRGVLEAVGLEYRVNPRLVRGMDYYNLTVFEWVTDQLGSQGTVCGGGRYDGLIEQLGGKSAPAVGFGLGIERLLLLVQALDLPVPGAAPDAYAVVAPGTPLPPVIATLEALRATGVRVVQHPAGADGLGSMKSQFKKADASGAAYALVFGADELAAGEVTVKALRDGSGLQVRRPLSAAAAWAATLQSQA